MRGAPIIIGICVGVLAAALLFAHQWSSEEPVVTPALQPVVAVVKHDAAIEPVRQVEAHDAPRATNEVVVDRPMVVNTIPSIDGAVTLLPMPEQSPYLGDSRELDYAEKLLTEPRVAMNRVESAKNVFARCLEEHPGLERCEKGFATAKALTDSAHTGAVQLTVEGPSTTAPRPVKSLQPTAPNTRIPRARP